MSKLKLASRRPTPDPCAQSSQSAWSSTSTRLDRLEVDRLIQAAYRNRSPHGLMIKTLFLTGARVSEFVQVRVEDLHLDSDAPQIHLVPTARRFRRQ